MFGELLTPEFIAAFMGLLGTILTVIIGAAAKAFRAYTGVQIEAKHRQALHEAMMSGVEAAITHGAGEGMRTIKQLAIAHAYRSVPDAMRALVPGDTVLDTIAERYAVETLNRWGINADGPASPANFTKPQG